MSAMSVFMLLSTYELCFSSSTNKKSEWTAIRSVVLLLFFIVHQTAASFRFPFAMRGANSSAVFLVMYPCFTAKL